MNLKFLTPRLALNKSYLKVKPNRDDMERFKTNLIHLIDQINEKETEEFHKNIISKFLDNTYYGGKHYINTKGKNDLVIHLDKTAKSAVGVIVETKKPHIKGEMVQQNNLNTKAFHELVLYYMRERISGNNLEVRHLIITNIHEWFFFDVDIFEKAFAQNKEFEKQFIDFEEKRLAGKRTDFFYKEIAEPAVQDLLSGNSKTGKEMTYTYFNLKTYDQILRNNDKKDDNKLIALLKLLSPEHLLKLPFKNDSNSLDKEFYVELLYIIGLTEIKEGGKKLIDRKEIGKRDEGSILENTINQLDTLDKISRVDKPNAFGATNEERYFNIGLELVITWINRILFLKLLEAQLISYHKGDKRYSFLNLPQINNFDDLNSLFFQVLAKQPNERSASVKELFNKIPYLNSSLFEPTDLEHSCLFISQLQDNKEIPIWAHTVLKDNSGKKKNGKLNALEYLFAFLDAYDFSSEGSEEIQEDNKTLISASVLGLIFEKINGYKDGSFFTPGFITMYMCREIIRKAIIQKFNKQKKWQCTSLNDLYNKIEDKKEANEIINDLKICDPAVGSGHFLVSALNEIIAIKSMLKILIDREGKTLRDYQVEVADDELAVTDDDGHLFEYNPRNKESQRVQETLFHEKQTLIEHCLFGVDINSNSVKICRLRLWIELLKNAYYKPDGNFTELETLPNIDINIKCGNSLISRFALGVDLSEALKKSRITIKSYRQAVQNYRDAQNKEQKREMEKLITSIKTSFRTEISNNDPKVKRLSIKRGDLNNLVNQNSLFELSVFEKKEIQSKVDRLTREVENLEVQIEEIKTNRIYENAFEWRFEFPEVLNDSGKYLGFDAVIGNPPYIRIQDLRHSNEKIVDYYNDNYQTTGSGNYDLYIPFIELGYNLLIEEGDFCYIMPHKFTNANYGERVREFILDKSFLRRIVHFGVMQIFEDASTYTGLFFMSKAKNDVIEYAECNDFTTLHEKNEIHFRKTPIELLTKEEWTFLSNQETDMLLKLRGNPNTLGSVTKRIFQGLKTSADKIYILQKLRDFGKFYKVHCRENKKDYVLEKTLLYPMIKGGNSRSYHISDSDLLILFPYKDGDLFEAEVLGSSYPQTWKYLNDHKPFLENRENGKMKNEHWYAYGRNQAIEVINLPKIFTPDIAPSPRFSYDSKGEFFFTGGTAGGYGIIPAEQVSLAALLAILNSPVAAWYISKTSTQMRGGWYSFESRYIKSIPIPDFSLNPIVLEQKVFDLIELKKRNIVDKASILENEIYEIVFQLYALSAEEIKIIKARHP